MKHSLTGAILFVAASAFNLGAAPSEEQAMVFVRDHQPMATIVVERNAGSKIEAAAKLLQSTIARSTGARLEIREAAGEGIAIRMGAVSLFSDLELDSKGLDQDGFILKPIDEKNYVIAGGGESGVAHGVCEFLERYLGARWLMPGELWEDIPLNPSLQVQAVEIRQEPVFLSRYFHPFEDTPALSASPLGEWARRNRLRKHVEGGHGLKALFPVEEFGKTHPEFYPLVGGKRLIPPPAPRHKGDRAHYLWQPNFSAPGIVDAAVGKIDDYFQRNPDAESIALGTNDGNDHYDQSAESLARRSGGKNSMGYVDVSDDYFLWANLVVEKSNAKHPSKWYGTLAYRAITDPPAYAGVHERIVPFITQERLRWIDPKLREADQKRTEDWAKVAANIGWYDYVFGEAYLVPRMQSHITQEYLRWAVAHRVRFYVAEMFPNWGEGPKPWLLARLVWNPERDVNALLDDWYERAAGAKAAPKLKAYFELWEKFWTQDILKSKWWHGKGPYLSYYNKAYLLEVPESYIRRSDILLNEAQELADTPVHKERVKFLRKMWEHWYRPNVVVYQMAAEAGAIPQTEADALESLEKSVAAISAMQTLKRFTESLVGDPAIRSNPLYERMASNAVRKRGPFKDHLNEGVSHLWRLLPWISESPKIKARIEQLAGRSGNGASEADGTASGPSGPSLSLEEHARILLNAAVGNRVPLLVNPSFEEGTDGWSLTVQTSKFPADYPFDETAGKDGKTFEITKLPGRPGLRALLVSAHRVPGSPEVLTPAEVSQSIPYKAGDYYAVVNCRIPAGVPQTQGNLVLKVLDKMGKEIALNLPREVLIPKPRRLNRIIVPFKLPQLAEGARLQIGLKLDLTTPLGDFNPNQKIYLDEVDVYRIE